MNANQKPITTTRLQRLKQNGEKIVSLTAYDATFARLIDEAGVDFILVGDTLGMVVQGLETTLPVTLDDVLYHTRMVRRGVKRALLVADMPFLSYQITPEEALPNAGRLMKEAGDEAILEDFLAANLWGTPDMIIKKLETRREQIGDFEVNGCFSFQSQPFDRVEDCMKLFAKEIGPMMHEWTPQAKAPVDVAAAAEVRTAK